MPSTALRRTFSAVILFAYAGIGTAGADDSPPPVQVVTPAGQKAGASQTPSMPSAAEQHRLPTDSSTRQTLELPGRTLSFLATAGSIRLFGDKGEPQADIAYTSYQLDGTDHGTRPVTFFFNGGPGSSSAWLQLGNAGPWRLPINAAEVTPSTFPEASPNAETWLDFSDLVFLDPVGTGYSRFLGTDDDVRKRLYSVDGDVNALAVVIRRWLEKHDRLLSPKYIAGESYGGIRGPKIVHQLQMREGIGVKGLIMISPVFDSEARAGLLQYVAALPSYAATFRELKGPVKRDDLIEVEAYARGEFLVDLMKGQQDKEATTRLADKAAALTGIDQATSRRLAGRIKLAEFRREFDRKSLKLIGNYDASVRGLDPYPDSNFKLSGDASSDTLLAPLTSASVDLLTRKLKWRPDGSYELINRTVGQAWDFGRSPPESVSQLRQILATDRKLKLLVGHGLFDLVTPYFGSQIVLDQLPPFASAPRVKLVVYPGGHMFYSRDASRQAFRAEVEAMMK
ncbi:S10 family peptidase [Bradyrhizobium sp. CCBAU 45384]|uniref:S10 family peptidase n=1 Tax=Bradyrhizobium sp. CCBAU 45384 TaxID=858428 RepID=UPI0023054CC2|nr:peptidase S10 [Bradyrhizobium sp. CCBAU 45384]MDA9408856.1 peptidase S10 [Bradyrhizobium sp. CCBAU 45384]